MYLRCSDSGENPNQPDQCSETSDRQDLSRNNTKGKKKKEQTDFLLNVSIYKMQKGSKNISKLKHDIENNMFKVQSHSKPPNVKYS